MHALETIEYKGCTIKVYQDEDAKSPREWDNLGTMWCAHNRYDLGDEQFRDSEPINEKQAEIENEGGIVLPLYLYDHSGITMRTSPFSCPWDSGQVGIIFVSRERILKEYGGKRITKKMRAQAVELLVGEVKDYDNLLTSSVYGYVTEGPNGEDIGSCWGFYPGEKDTLTSGYMIDEAKGEIEYWRKQQAKEKREQRRADKLEREAHSALIG